MLNEIAKDLVQAVKENVELGIKSVMDKVSPQIEAIQKQIEDISKQELDLSKVSEVVEEKISSIPVPKDGEDGKDAEPINMDEVKALIKQAVDEAVSQIKVPEPREPIDGRDALQIEIEPNIDQSKSYPRGTYALHKGGLWRSFEKTNEYRGWEVVLDGIADIKIDFDGQRSFKMVAEKSSGYKVEKGFEIPAMIYKDVWREGSYKAQDCVTLSGSLWVALKDTNLRPGDSSDDWRIVAKKGGTGKSAFDIAREAGFSGTRQDWLDSIGKTQTVKI